MWFLNLQTLPRIPTIKSLIEHVDCTVYTFAFLSHAIQILDWCVYYECVCILTSLPLSPYRAPDPEGLLTLVNVLSLEKYQWQTPCIWIALCSFHTLQPDALTVCTSKQVDVLVPALPPTGWMTLGKAILHSAPHLLMGVREHQGHSRGLQTPLIDQMGSYRWKALKTMKCYTNVRHYYFSN